MNSFIQEHDRDQQSFFFYLIHISGQSSNKNPPGEKLSCQSAVSLGL